VNLAKTIRQIEPKVSQWRRKQSNLQRQPIAVDFDAAHLNLNLTEKLQDLKTWRHRHCCLTKDLFEVVAVVAAAVYVVVAAVKCAAEDS
jgi:hypothetical protein